MHTKRWLVVPQEHHIYQHNKINSENANNSCYPVALCLQSQPPVHLILCGGSWEQRKTHSEDSQIKQCHSLRLLTSDTGLQTSVGWLSVASLVKRLAPWSSLSRYGLSSDRGLASALSTTWRRYIWSLFGRPFCTRNASVTSNDLPETFG